MQRGRKSLKRSYPSASESDGEEARSSSALKSARHQSATRASTRVRTRAGLACQARSQQKHTHEQQRKAGSQTGDGNHARALPEPQRQLRNCAARSHSPTAASEASTEEAPDLPEPSPPGAVRRSRRGERMSESASEQPEASCPTVARRSERGSKRGSHPAAAQKPLPPRTVRRSSKRVNKIGPAASAQESSEEDSEQPGESSPPRTVRRSTRRRKSSRLVQGADGISSDDEEISGEDIECLDPSIWKRPTQKHSALLMHLCHMPVLHESYEAYNASRDSSSFCMQT